MIRKPDQPKKRLKTYTRRQGENRAANPIVKAERKPYVRKRPAKKGRPNTFQKVRRSVINYLFHDPQGNTWIARQGIHKFVDWYNLKFGTDLSTNAFQLKVLKQMQGRQEWTNRRNKGWRITILPALTPQNTLYLKGKGVLHLNFTP